MSAVDHDEKYYRKSWMSDDQWWCAQTWSLVMGGFHHCSDFRECGGTGVEVSEFASGFSTFDFDRLTRAIFHAHDRCVRIELASSSPHRVKFRLHRRDMREGSMAYRHPTIEQALERHRKHFQNVDVCWCHKCRPRTINTDRMTLCPECQNKRCPKASDHELACTGSNEPGQPGSIYKAAFAHENTL